MLQDCPASVVVPIDKLSVLVTVLFSSLVLREAVSRQYLVGLALLVGGTLARIAHQKAWCQTYLERWVGRSYLVPLLGVLVPRLGALTLVS